MSETNIEYTNYANTKNKKVIDKNYLEMAFAAYHENLSKLEISKKQNLIEIDEDSEKYITLPNAETADDLTTEGIVKLTFLLKNNPSEHDYISWETASDNSQYMSWKTPIKADDVNTTEETTNLVTIEALKAFSGTNNISKTGELTDTSINLTDDNSNKVFIGKEDGNLLIDTTILKTSKINGDVTFEKPFTITEEEENKINLIILRSSISTKYTYNFGDITPSLSLSNDELKFD